MAVDKEDLLKFYISLNTSIKLLLRFRLRQTVGRTFEELASEEPWRIYPSLVEALSEHNAEVILNMFANWLMNRGERISVDDLRSILSDKRRWLKL